MNRIFRLENADIDGGSGGYYPDVGRRSLHKPSQHFQYGPGQNGNLRYAEAIKKARRKDRHSPQQRISRTGLQRTLHIVSGKTDMVAMARLFISDPECVKTAHESRGEDWVPRVICNKCHELSQFVVYYFTVCSVNSKFCLKRRFFLAFQPSFLYFSIYFLSTC